MTVQICETDRATLTFQQTLMLDRQNPVTSFMISFSKSKKHRNAYLGKVDLHDKCVIEVWKHDEERSSKTFFVPYDSKRAASDTAVEIFEHIKKIMADRGEENLQARDIEFLKKFVAEKITFLNDMYI